MTNHNTNPGPRKRAKHAAQVSTKVETTEEFPDALRKSAPISAIVLPLAVLLLGLIRSVGNTFERLCPEPLEGRCAEVPLAGQIPILSDLALTFGIVLALLAIVLIVEMLTWRYKTKVAYTGLVLLAVFVMLTGSGAFEMVFETIAENYMQA